MKREDHRMLHTKPLWIHSTVWRQGEASATNHFVYGLAVSNQGTILAFAESRLQHQDDAPHHLVLKRSTDGGLTWGPAQTIEQSIAGECWANPTALVERNSGRIFLFYVLNEHNSATRVFYRTSDDDGLSWSPRHEVTEPLTADNPYGWTVFMPGPGHGVQLSNGRLILPLWARKEITLSATERDYGNRLLYSDDQGETWHAGGIVPLNRELRNNESRIVELSDGMLLWNARTFSRNHRAMSLSRDQGMTWSPMVPYTKLPVQYACDGGFVTWANAPGYERAPLLYSTISKQRHDPENTLQVYLSVDDGNSWPLSKTVHNGPCNYSDIAVMPDGTVVVLYGAGALPQCRSAAVSVSCVRFNAVWFHAQE
jgi:Neuraminidase (sialidase)